MMSIFLLNFSHTMQYTHEQVRLLFDRIAHRYDLLNTLLSLGADQYWRRRVIASCRTLRRPRILDVATGTGDFLQAAADLNPESLTGLDLSRAMLLRAKKKLERSSSCLVEGLAESLPFRDSSFDLVLVGFGVRNFSIRELGLNELRRVLRDGGQLRILDFSRPRGIFRRIYMPYFRRILPKIGGAMSGNTQAYLYLPDTVMDFPEPEAFSIELHHAGFTGIRWDQFTFGIVTHYEATAA